MDSALRAIFLTCLDRDLRFARPGILGDVVMPTRWGCVTRAWGRARRGAVRATVQIIPDSPEVQRRIREVRRSA